MLFTAAEIAAEIGGELVGDGGVELHGFSPADDARPGDLTFAESEAFFEKAEKSQASAILVSSCQGPSSKTLVRVKDARVAFARVLPLFFPEEPPEPGIHPSAVVAGSAQIASTAHIGPHCVVGEQTAIGSHCILKANISVGDNCHLDDGVCLFPNVTVYPQCRLGKRVRVHAGSVLGSDGYGYVFDQDHHRKVPQIGGLVIGDDVEIGAGVTIDRGALGDTIIGQGTKIDNLVQIAHNVVLGKHCLIVAQTGLAGSTKVGDLVTFAGQSASTGHLKIGDRVVIAGRGVVANDVAAGGKYMGFPARPDREVKREMLALRQLPDLVKRFRQLEKQLTNPQPGEGGE